MFWLRFDISARLNLFPELYSLPYEQVFQRIRFVSLLASFCFLCWFPYPVRKYSSGLVQLSRLASLCLLSWNLYHVRKYFNWLVVFSTGFVSFSQLDSWPYEQVIQWIRFVVSPCLILLSHPYPYLVSTDSSGFVLFSHLASSWSLSWIHYPVGKYSSVFVLLSLSITVSGLYKALKNLIILWQFLIGCCLRKSPLSNFTKPAQHWAKTQEKTPKLNKNILFDGSEFWPNSLLEPDEKLPYGIFSSVPVHELHCHQK